MGQRDYELGEAELQVLRALWDGGPATVREVLNHLHTQGRRVAYTTVLTFLTRLEQKGFVKSDKSGLAYVYRAAVTRNQVTRSRLQTMLNELFDGEAAPLVDALVEELRSRGYRVETGRFRAHMEVSLVNDGPVTLVADF